MRDFLTDEVDAIIIDDAKACEHMQELVGQISKRAKQAHPALHRRPSRSSIVFGVQAQIDAAFHRQVWLPCGGYIVIDETEALIAVDVNTGRNKGCAGNMEKTILQTNLEAADEICRQMRLRNIGGIIIADFIDMKHRKDQQAVYQRVKDRLKRDKARTHVLPISPTRPHGNDAPARAPRVWPAPRFVPCPHCNRARGMVKSPMTMSVELQRALHSVMRKHQDTVHEIKVVVAPDLLTRLAQTKTSEHLASMIERCYAGRLSFRSDSTFHQEKFLDHQRAE